MQPRLICGKKGNVWDIRFKPSSQVPRGDITNPCQYPDLALASFPTQPIRQSQTTGQKSQWNPLWQLRVKALLPLQGRANKAVLVWIRDGFVGSASLNPTLSPRLGKSDTFTEKLTKAVTLGRLSGL